MRNITHSKGGEGSREGERNCGKARRGRYSAFPHCIVGRWRTGDETCRGLLASVTAELQLHYLWQLPAVGQTGREQVDTVH